MKFTSMVIRTLAFLFQSLFKKFHKVIKFSGCQILLFSANEKGVQPWINLQVSILKYLFDVGYTFFHNY